MSEAAAANGDTETPYKHCRFWMVLNPCSDGASEKHQISIIKAYVFEGGDNGSCENAPNFDYKPLCF